jgi:hypothetical protein
LTPPGRLRPSLSFIEEQRRPVGINTHAPHLVYRTREEALSFPDWLHNAVIQVFLQPPDRLDAGAVRSLSMETLS